MKIFLTLATFVFLLGSARAELAASHQAAIEKLLTVMQVQKQFEISLAAGFEAGMGLNGDKMKALPQEQQDKLAAVMAKVKTMLTEMMSWDTLKPDFLEVYGKNFTEQEALEVVKLMETPTGQMLVAKQQLMIKDIMVLSQDRMKTIMPKIMQVVQEEMSKAK